MSYVSIDSDRFCTGWAAWPNSDFIKVDLDLNNPLYQNMSEYMSEYRLKVDYQNFSGMDQWESDIVWSGSSVTDSVIVSGDRQFVHSGGTANSTTINSGGKQYIAPHDEYSCSGGVANSTTINGGEQLISGGGVANFTTINSGGKQYICSNFSGIADGGVVNSTTINNGGEQRLEVGTANFTTINSGGIQRVGFDPDGLNRKITANFTTVKSGGIQAISSGGVANSTLLNGGYQIISSGGVTSNTIVNSGGSVYVSSGGSVTGSLTIDGGHVTVEYSDGMQLAAMNFKLAHAQTNDAILTIQSGGLSDINTAFTPFSLDVNNTATGVYIIESGTDLTAMSDAVFSVADNGQNVDIQVGHSYTFADGDKLSLNLTDAATDQLTAVFTVGGPVILPEITVFATDAVAGEPANNGTFRISRTGDTTSLLTVNFSTGGTATSGSDYTLKNGSTTLTSSVVIAAGQSYVDVTLGVIDDAIVESTETATLNLAANSAYSLGATTSGTINITDNEVAALSTVTIAVQDATAGEPADNGTFRISRTGDITNALTVYFDVSGGAKQRGQIYLTVMDYYDYYLKKGGLVLNNGVTIDAGQSYVDVTLGVIDDVIVEGTETAIFNLTDNAAYSLGATTSGTINITDNDTDVGNTPETARVREINDSNTEWVGLGDPADYYKLTLDNAGKLSMNLADLTGDANITLYDAKGKTLKISNNKGLVDENITNMALLKGDYYVKVAPAVKSTDTDYTLSNTVDYFPTDTVGNTQANASMLDANGFADEWVGFGDPADYYKLTLDSAGKLSINITGLSGDVNMTLYDAKGKSLKSSSVKGLADESISNLALTRGDYFIKVVPGPIVNDAYYTLSNTMDYFPADTVGNTLATAGVLETNGFADEWVGFGDASDYYKLTLDSAGTLSLNLTGLSSDANLTLYDAKGKSLKSSSLKGLEDENIANLSLLKGDYFVKITPASGVFDASYKLSNTVGYFPTDTAGDTLASALPVMANGPVDEWLGFGDKDDYYMFELQTATAVNLDLTDMSSNVNMYLYDSKNKQLAASAKSGNTDESITKTLAAGKYYVKATLAGKENTDYSLNFGIDPSAFKVGSLQLSSAASPLSGSTDTGLTGDPLKKNNGLLAS
jgi:autotransporter passenger strand-loop-strand repeat protein